MSEYGLTMIPKDDYWTTTVNGALVHNWIIDGYSLTIPNTSGIVNIGEDDHWRDRDGLYFWRKNNMVFGSQLVLQTNL